MATAQVPMLPGSSGVCVDSQSCLRAARQIGYPVMVKAVAGGGGRGMGIARTEDELAETYRETRATAQSLYGDNRVYLERYLDHARHVEVQVLADGAGRAVALGDRDCSIQRRHQKLIEEAPAPHIPPETRSAMARCAIDGVLAAGLVGAATVEFLVDRDGHYYFLEVNARLQVEHPVTEMVTGVDIVEQQLRLAAGEPLLPQRAVTVHGAALECRLNAEDPGRDFQPTPGTLDELRLPGGPFTRVDTHCTAGSAIPPFYDPLIGKVFTWGADRGAAIARMRRALSEVRIGGNSLRHNTDLLLELLAVPEFVAGTHSTQLLPTVRGPATTGEAR
jgi:acetyl-CoA carboxylase biotin carboxylase subunit